MGWNGDGCSRARVAYDDGGVPVGDLGVVVEGGVADCLLAGLPSCELQCLGVDILSTHAAGNLLQLLSGKR
jgi:hypothetical protein